MTEKTQAFILIALSVVAATVLCAIGKLDPNAATAIIGGAIVAARGVITPGRPNGRGPLGVAVRPENGQHRISVPEQGSKPDTHGQNRYIDVVIDESCFKPSWALGPLLGMLLGSMAPEITPLIGSLW